MIDKAHNSADLAGNHRRVRGYGPAVALSAFEVDPMSEPCPISPHRFHIPVMGTGFTIDTPLRVARFGISSVVSLVDDVLIDQMRKKLSETLGRSCEEIDAKDVECRERRISAYLNLLHDEVQLQVERMRQSAFDKGSELTKYFEMLPPGPARTLYERMREAVDEDHRAQLQEKLRSLVQPGSIDVNIMTKLDRPHLRGGKPVGPLFSDALTALRGFARSRLHSSVILSAGMNRGLFAHMADFEDFYPNSAGELRKKIVLKVSDLRSAVIQGRMLAKKGLWVSEYRIESGLNCGGHAFGGGGRLLGPILDEFRREREAFVAKLHRVLNSGLKAVGRDPLEDPLPVRITVQGGIGTSEENEMLYEVYGVDGTGWGSPFLFCPEAVNIDDEHLQRLCESTPKDVELSRNSPLGVPFWSLRTSASENLRRRRIEEGQPGSDCPKGFLVSNTEYTERAICTASRRYQNRKLQEIASANLDPVARDDALDLTLTKACLCRDLAGSAARNHGFDESIQTTVCCGPNTVYYQRPSSLREMVDHIYGRAQVGLSPDRPHMFLKELSLHVDRLKEEVQRRASGLATSTLESSLECKSNLLEGIAHYRAKAREIVRRGQGAFLERLEDAQAELEALLPEHERSTRG